METVAFLLSPLIELMRLTLEAINRGVGSYGISIILLSIIVRLLMVPISRMALRAEQRHIQLQLAMEPALAEIRAVSVGRDRFERIESLYQEHRYHPIQSVFSLLPLLLQLPFLLAALILLTGYPELNGHPFLFVRDLSEPDRLLAIGFISQGAAINLLPLLVTGVALTESYIKRNATRSSRRRFFIVSAVILVLIYPLPSAVCLYWLTSNLWTLFGELKALRWRAES